MVVMVGRKYLVCGKYVKVVEIGDRIEVVWGHNGQTPKRDGDRFISRNLVPHFKEI